MSLVRNIKGNFNEDWGVKVVTIRTYLKKMGCATANCLPTCYPIYTNILF